MTTTPDLSEDVAYLRDEFYRDSTRLDRGIDLHRTYSDAPVDAFSWLIGQIDWPEGAEVLDVGCGNGMFWEAAAAIAPAGMHLHLADLSSGMATQAAARARATGHYSSVVGHACDARLLPFVDESFDVVVSTYTLFHVPDPEVAAAQIARVLRPGGVAIFLTYGPGHMREVFDVVYGGLGAGVPSIRLLERFAPARAAEMLVGLFDEVTWRRFDENLLITDVDDLMDYLSAGPPIADATPEQRAALRAAYAERMDADGGVLRATTNGGALIARRPMCPRLA